MMNKQYYIKANRINCDPLYRSKVQFMTLGEIKELHRSNGLSDNIRLDQEAIISTLELMKEKP